MAAMGRVNCAGLSKALLGQSRKLLESIGGNQLRICSLHVENIEGDSYALGAGPQRHARRLLEGELGGQWETRYLNSDCTLNELLASVAALNADPHINGIVIARPSPSHFSRKILQQAVDPLKDVEGMHPGSIGKLVYGTGDGRASDDSLLYPCTAKASVLVLKQAYEELGRGASLQGAEALVVGNSDVLAKPVVSMLHNEGATVTVCDPADAYNFAAYTRTADVVLSAAGPGYQGLIRSDMLKPNAVLIDLGLHISPKGKLLGGDADLATFSDSASLAKFASLRCGVGAVRSAVLCGNLVRAAALQKQN